ncbi:tyrosine-type recombinase/integrase [uncultured Jatrophihabitans sp.]|uniref:tyrosine-type recombinase/integrase n=1 Tax=uncultured Jatrophihabitans sp. TaxID=1610747 RepID=UPI0035C999C7
MTRSASMPSIKLLSRPESPYLSPVAADDRFGPSGMVRPLWAYDAGQPPPAAPADSPTSRMQRLSIEEVSAAISELVSDPLDPLAATHEPAARMVLNKLAAYPGETWEQRWLASGYDAAARTWADQFQRPAPGERSIPVLGMNTLLQARVLRPSFSWLLDSQRKLDTQAFLHAAGGPDLDALRRLPAYERGLPRQQRDVEAGLARIMIRTGKAIEQITGDDLLHYADIVKTSGRHRREHLLWELLVQLAPLAGEARTLRATWSAKGNTRQHSTATLVDRYGIARCGVRDLLVDYLDEIRPGMDYGSLEGLAYRLVRLFWCNVVQINPEQADLRLSPAVATAWRERLALTMDGSPRRETHSVLFAIRGFYRDLAEWSHDDPVRWGVWVAPCPVPRSVSRAVSKAKRRSKSEMHDRTRMLTPLLPALVTAAAEQKQRTSRFLELAAACQDGERFELDGHEFVRDSPTERYAHQQRLRVWVRSADGQPRPDWIRQRHRRIDVTAAEHDGFWGWAVVETLRHTGIRIEELTELTQLSLRHYTSQSTGTLVPLLHIVPSKTDCERLIPMSPELVQVLLAVLRRAKAGQDRVPLSIRYDNYEKTHGEPFPHLFSRPIGTRQEVLSMSYVRQLLNHLAVISGVTDAGQPVRFTPHDFRRLFATDAVNGGLPLHIAAALLGHLNLDTTRGYTAVFPEHIITAHQAFIERRRELRPFGEDRLAEPDEWAEFEQHFTLRQVALGECHRPYGTPCVHEHVCTRCRFLRVDPAQLGRIEEMTDNAEQRLSEAKQKVWLGEVAGLEDSLKHLRARRAEALRRLDQGDNAFADNTRQ